MGVRWKGQGHPSPHRGILVKDLAGSGRVKAEWKTLNGPCDIATAFEPHECFTHSKIKLKRRKESQP
jgi:hypothetical protein